MNHTEFMQRCLQLAEFGSGYVSPNPLVGCVIVHQGQIIGEGFHRYLGGPHAEVEAIRSVKDPGKLSESTLYVNLEPCCHYGKTPPCADLIIESKIPTVVMAVEDPNPLVGGKGRKKLEDNGVEVISGVLEDEAKMLNRRFFSHQIKQRPFITLKWAQTADGYIDNNQPERLKITGKATDVIMHKRRFEEDAILVGYNTALKDNPTLDCRLVSDKSLLRIVIDKNNSLPRTHKLLADGKKTVILNELMDDETDYADFVKINDINNPEEILSAIFSYKVGSILIEGGAKTLNMFIHHNLWDEAIIIDADFSIGSGIAAPQLKAGILHKRFQSDKDRISYFINENRSF